MCTILHDLMCSSTYRCYLNGDSQISLFTSDLLPTVQSHICGCHSNIYYSCPILEFKKFCYFFLRNRPKCFSSSIIFLSALLLVFSQIQAGCLLAIFVLLGVLPCISSLWVLSPLSHALSLFPFLVQTLL